MMIELFEKFTVGLSALCVVLLAVAYLLVGTPSTKSREFIPPVQPIAAAAPATTKGREPPPPPKPLTQEDRPVLQALERQGSRIRAERLTRKSYRVPTPLFEEMSNTATITKELRKARSTVLRTANGDTRLRIHDISSDSLLRRFGLEDGDIIELIDGEIREFNGASAGEHLSVFRDKLDRMRRGEAVSVTVSRGGVPVHLEFKL